MDASGQPASVSNDSRHTAVAVMHGIVGAMTLVAIWIGLPARWLWVDLPATSIAVASLISSVALLSQRTWGVRFARAVTRTGLALGCITVTLLAWAASQLVGQYGPVGGGGALLLGTVAALIVPYFIGLPVLQHWLLRQRP